MLKRIDIDISHSNMCNWQIAAGRKCQVLIDMLWVEALKGPFLQMDETTCQVLKEPGRPPDKKSYMWITIGYTKKHRPILVYHYHPSRSERIPLSILKNYKREGIIK